LRCNFSNIFEETLTGGPSWTAAELVSCVRLKPTPIKEECMANQVNPNNQNLGKTSKTNTDQSVRQGGGTMGSANQSNTNQNINKQGQGSQQGFERKNVNEKQPTSNRE